MNAVPLQQETTLPEPPQAETVVVLVRAMNVREQRVVGLDWLDH
jgi:hypothetical protein